MFILFINLFTTVDAKSMDGITYTGPTPSDSVKYDPSLLKIDQSQYSTAQNTGSGHPSGVIPNIMDLFYTVPSVHDGEKGIPQAKTVPSSYDSRNASIVPDVRDQGYYGVCWSFGTNAMADVSAVLDGRETLSASDHSELQTAYFMRNRVADPLNLISNDSVYAPDGRSFLSGNNYSFVTHLMPTWTGTVAESLVPYSQANSSLSLNSDYAYKSDNSHAQNLYILNLSDTSDVKNMIMTYGIGGISYSACDNNVLNTSTGAYYNDGNGTSCGGHAVTVIGWNDDYSKSNFLSGHQPSNNGAWLVRNSWGKYSGSYQNSGYFWMSYEETTLEDAIYFYDFDKSDNYTWNYQYDGTAGDARITTDAMANVFTAQNNISIKAVSFQNVATNINYTIKVYTNVTGTDNPENGTLSLTQSGSETYAGVHTIPLSSAVVASKDSKFSIVVDLSTASSSSTGYYYDATYENGTWIAFTDNIQAGQSYKKNSSGSWTDMVNYTSGYYGPGNARIKAYGDPLTEKPSFVNAVPRDRGIDLKWGAVSGATSYRVLISSTAFYQWDESLAKIVTATELDWSGLENGKTYYFCIWPYFNGIPGDKWAEITGKPTQDKPYGIVTYPLDGGVLITWNKVPDADGYVILGSDTAYYSWNLSFDTDQTSLEIYSLANGTKYYFCVWPYKNVNGSKVFSDKWTDFTETPEAFGKPSEITSYTDGKNINLSWPEVKNADGYQVLYSNTAYYSWTSNEGITDNSYTITANPGLTYYICVWPFRTINGKRYWGNSWGTITVANQLGNIEDLKSDTQYNQGVKLEWSSAKGATGYRVYISSTAYYSWEKTIDVTGTVYYADSLENNKRYYFCVRPYITMNGTQTLSDQWRLITAMPKALARTTSCTATAGNGSVSLSWAAVPDADGYSILSSSTKYYSWGTWNATTSTNITVSGLPNEKPEYFCIWAYQNITGNDGTTVKVYPDEWLLIEATPTSVSGSSKTVFVSKQGGSIVDANADSMRQYQESINLLNQLDTLGNEVHVMDSILNMSEGPQNNVKQQSTEFGTLSDSNAESMKINYQKPSGDINLIDEYSAEQIRIMSQNVESNTNNVENPEEMVNTKPDITTDATQAAMTEPAQAATAESTQVVTAEPVQAATAEPTQAVSEINTVENVEPVNSGELSVTNNNKSQENFEFYSIMNDFWASSMHDGKVILPSTGFPTGKITNLDLQPKLLSYGVTGYSIEIPSIDSKANLVSVPLDQNSEYEVEWLGSDAGLLQGSELPGKGISVIAAHNHLNTMETGPFLFLLNVKQGDRIFVRTAGNELLSYVVYENISLKPDDVETINRKTKAGALILITCEDESTEGKYLHRRVVFAEPD